MLHEETVEPVLLKLLYRLSSLAGLRDFVVQQMTKAAVLGHIENIKVDFICHKYPWVKPPEKINGLTIASLEDISAMKLNAISGSGIRLKDFVDVAFLSGYMPFSEMLNHFEQKYPNINAVVAIKSLCYFNDIDFSTKIEYTDKPLSWEVIRRRIMQMVQEPNKRFAKL